MRRFLAGLLAALMVLSLCACGAADAPGKTDGQTAAVSWDELVFDRTMPLRYAEQFSVEYAGGASSPWTRPEPSPPASRRSQISSRRTA